MQNKYRLPIGSKNETQTLAMRPCGAYATRKPTSIGQKLTTSKQSLGHKQATKPSGTSREEGSSHV